jgi:very-short-patch-repair endonuclease
MDEQAHEAIIFAQKISAKTKLLPSPRLRRGGVGGGGTMSNRTPRRIDRRVPRARTLRRDVTEVEKKLWQYLRQPPFKDHHFRRQATIGPYFADFASHTLRIVIELDGGQHNVSASDAARTRDLESRGYRMLRFWNHDVLSNIAGVAEAILKVIDEQMPPTPDPSPPQAGGGE